MASPSAGTVTKPRRVAVLLNASSGKLDGDGRDQLRQTLEAAFAKNEIAANIEFLPAAELQDAATRNLGKIGAGELDAIVIGGGDGTIRTAAAVMADSGFPLGIIPLGTLNHFAKDLKIPLSIEEAVAVIAAAHTTPVDVGKVNGRVFINNSSVGFYPYLVLDRERQMRRHGLSKWPAMVLAVLRMVRNLPVRRLHIRAQGWTEPCRSPCVFVGNNQYKLTGLSLGGREKLDEGQLCLYVARQQSVGALFWLACRNILGLFHREHDFRMMTLPAVEISSHHRRLLVAFDGEIEPIELPLQYQTRPGALLVYTPRAAG